MIRLQITLGLLLIVATMFLVLYMGVSDLTVRLEAETQAQLARSIESGAGLYDTYCAYCHGEYGEGRIGPTLNTPVLFDTGPNGRLAQMGWTGSVETFLESTILSGRPRSAMQPWSERFGGPLRDDEVRDLVNFIRNWEPAAGQFPKPLVKAEVTPIMPAQMEVIGQEMFYKADYLGCGSCHTIAGVSEGKVGPDLSHIGSVAEERAREAGVASAEEYIRQSIVDSDAFTVQDCPLGPCLRDVMPTAFGQILSEDQVAALVTYLAKLR